MPRYFDFEVTLVLPRRIWRRFLLQKSATFADLHLAIQDAFGWENCHLHEFRHPGHERKVLAGMPDPDMPDMPDGRTVKLKDHVSSGDSGATWFEYMYDFGDGWIHEVKVRDEVSLPDTFKRRLLDGERAAPPEDAGGTGGYERIISVAEQGIDPHGHLSMIRDWLGDWDPDDFDLEDARPAFDGPLAGPAKRSRRGVHN